MCDVNDQSQQSRSQPKPVSDSKRTFWNHTLQLLIGNGTAQILRACLTPIITRLYSPIALGIAQNYSAIGKTASVLATLRYEDSIQLPEQECNAFKQMVTAILCTVVNSLLSIVIVLTIRTPIVNVLNAPQLTNLLPSIPVFILLRGIFLSLREWHIRKEQFKRVSVAAAGESVIWDLGTMSLGVMGFTGSASITLAQLLGQGAATGLLAFPLIKKKNTVKFTWKEIIEGLREFRKFPQFNFWSKLLDNTALYLPVWLFSAFFSPAIAGQFTLGFNLLQLPFAMIANTMGQVLYQQAPGANRQQILAEEMLSLISIAVKLALPVILLFCLSGYEIFIIIFGINWQQAGKFVQILSPWMLFILLSLIIERIPSIFNKNENILIFQALNNFARIISLLIGAKSKNPVVAVILLSVGGCLVYGMNILWTLHLSGTSIKKIFFTMTKAFGQTLPLGVTLIISRLLINSYRERHSLYMVAIELFFCFFYYLYLLLNDVEVKIILSSIKKEIRKG